MVNTSATPMTVDGVRLDTYAYNIETLAGRIVTPGVRGGNPVVPGRHGSIYIPNKVFDDNELTLSMWVIGADVDGLVPSGNQLLEMRKNMDTLSRLFGKRVGKLDVRQTWPAGDRQVLCEVLQSYDWTARAIQPQAKFSVALNVPDVFWQDVSTQDYASATGLTTGSQLTISTTAGATAPIEDAVIVVRGPATNPRVMDTLSGTWVQLNGTIASGTDWQIDCGAWTTRTGSAILFTAGAGTNAVATTTYGGGGSRFVSLSPSATGSVLAFTGSGLGTNTQVQVRARRKYLL